MLQILPQTFYNQMTLTVARELLGACLVREIDGKVIRARIVETEAYIGEDDKACHASRGRTPRTEVMYGEAGRAYVYMIYGMYHCFNIVTQAKDFPSAVLIRSIEMENISFKQTNGPGKLCRFFAIDRSLNAWDITQGEKLWIEKGDRISDEFIEMTPRVGIDYAQEYRDKLWRFVAIG